MSGPWKPVASRDSPPRAYSPPRASAAPVSDDPFAGSDAFGAAGGYDARRPPASPPPLATALDAGATLGGGGAPDAVVPAIGGKPASPPRGGRAAAAAAAPPPRVPPPPAIPFVDTALGSAPPPPPPSTAANGGRTALLGGAPGSSSGAVGGAPAADADGTRAGVFSLRRYRKHFNVDTGDVLHRMRASLTGALHPTFLDATAAGDAPDLYGPFWIATTLVFLSAVAGNAAAWASWRRTHKGAADAPAWYYDVDKVGFAAALFYGYVGGVGVAVWATLRWLLASPLPLPVVWCVYGYSLTPFLPVAPLAALPYEGARWGLIVGAAAVSGAFLLLNLRPAVFGGGAARAAPAWTAMAVAHAGVAVALKLSIFHYRK